MLLNRAPATDWPQFMGPNHDLITPDEAPGPWSATGPRVVWRVPMAGGHASLAVVKGVVYTVTTNGCEALDAKSGRQLWMTNASVGLAYSTPSVCHGRVYVVAAKGVLACLNATNGAVLWSQSLTNYVVKPGAESQYGNSLSPLVEDGRVFVFWPGQTNCALAFNATNGDLLWKGLNCQLSYASPTMGTFGGVRQLVYSGGNGLVGLSPADGSLLWRGSTGQTHLTPTVYNESLVCPEGARGVLNVVLTNGTWGVTQAWSSTGFRTQWTPPVVAGDHIYELIDDALACVDLQTGATRWATNGFGWGGIIRAGNRLVVLAQTGRVELVEPDPLGYRPLCAFQALTGTCFDLPVVVDGRIYARSDTECVCLDTNPPADLRLELCANPNRTCDAEIGTTDGSMIDPSRTNRIELYQAPQLPAGTAGWSRTPPVGVYTNGALRYRNLPASGIRFYRARETKP